MTLLTGIKALIKDPRTKKKAYKLMAGVVKRFEFDNIAELSRIHTDLTSMVDGQATKQRIVLLDAYVTQIKTFLEKDAAASGEVAAQLLKHYILELINSLNNSNPKVRALAN